MTKNSFAACFAMLMALLFQGCANQNTTERIQNGVQLKTKEMLVKVQFYAPHTVRVVKWLPEGTFEKNSLMVINDSLPDLNINVEETGTSVILRSDELFVEISKETGALQYSTSDDTKLLSEAETSFTPVVYDNDSAYQIRQNFTLTPNEGIYGLGQHQYGYLNYRGKKVTLVQSNTDAVNPFLISTKGYGILWDNYSKTVFDDSNDEASLWSDVADNVDYYVIYDGKMDGAIAGYRHLTGHAPMFGKWAYGFWQSKEHYDTQDELMSVAREYRRRQIPIDNIIQDWDYWNGPENWSGMFFDKTLFPKPIEMVRELHEMNYHMMISIWPALGPNTEIYKDMEQKGYLYAPIGWAGFKYYDAFNPAANELYWKYLREGLYDKGIDGWWIDSTEPDVINALNKGATEYEMKKVGNTYLGSWARYLNAFSLSMTDALYKNFRAETAEKRVYILTRSTFAGQQRNAATTWSGDIGASWEVYKHQIAAGLNHSMSGIPYWTFDIGAFKLGSYEGVFSTGTITPAYQELYTRMFQFGAFCPIFRSHGSDVPREVWHFGEYENTLIKYDNLRYRLMPYIYSLAWKVTDADYTPMRGLAMDFASDEKTYSIDDQYMYGPAMMVCPVTDFMYHRPPASTELIDSKYFQTPEGEQGLKASYYTDTDFQNLSLERVDPRIDINWYEGRPEYATDSMYSIRWNGKLIPEQTGEYQFHIKSFDSKKIFIDGKQIQPVLAGSEEYSNMVNLTAGQSYDIVVETSNNQRGAAQMLLFWKTPEMFANEKQPVDGNKTRSIYLPADHDWIDFWTGKKQNGGQTIETDAPIDIMPLFVKAGSIIPMGPFLQYTTEKPADTIELRIYPGADGSFSLYEDENDNYNYEKGVYATIDFQWNDAEKTLVIGKREGEFPGMLKKRTFNAILVGEGHGDGLEIEKVVDKVVEYSGEEMVVQF